MAEGKRYYWLKLKDDFFTSKRIKKLRHMAGGDTYTIIYLKMQLLSLRTDGVLRWSGLEEQFADELALDLDEKPEDVEVTLMYLLNVGLAETTDYVTYFLPWVLENTGSETASTQRVRDFRARQKTLLQCNADVTQVKRIGNAESESEKEIEKEIEKESESESDKRPTLAEVKDFAQEIGSNVDPERFFQFYSGKDWMTGSEPINDWKAVFRKWSAGEKPKKQKQYTTAKEYASVAPKKIDAAAVNKVADLLKQWGVEEECTTSE